MKKNLKELIAAIKNNAKFLITTHTNAEGDALGSELAFYLLLKALGKGATVINEDAVPLEYRFLPAIDRIIKFNPRQLKNIRFDCFVLLDCSDLGRCGEVATFHKDNGVLINIDHHISNGLFADINWVEPATSSTSEMVYGLYKKLHIPFDDTIALLLYVGILTDTGSFHYSNTTSFTHKAAADLLRYNLNVPQIYKHIYENIPLKDLRILGKVVSDMQRDASGKIAWFRLPAGTIKKLEPGFDSSEYLLSFARAIKDIEVAVLFKENLGVKDEIRVNLRSQGPVDVNKIAAFFGGGGHRTASGCTLKGNLDSAIKKVLKKVRSSLAELPNKQ